jgi:hypothetical protein
VPTGARAGASETNRTATLAATVIGVVRPMCARRFPLRSAPLPSAPLRSPPLPFPLLPSPLLPSPPLPLASPRLLSPRLPSPQSAHCPPRVVSWCAAS